MRQRIARTFFGLLLACWPLLSQAQSQRPAPTPTVFDQPALVQRYQATIDHARRPGRASVHRGL